MTTFSDVCKTQILDILKDGVFKEPKVTNLKIATALTEAFENAEPHFRRVFQPPTSTKTSTAPTTRTTRSRVADKGETSKRAPNWQNIWSSADRGGKSFFLEDYESIKSGEERFNHFTVLSKLRDLVEGDGRFEQWWKQIQKDHEDAPGDPPSQRQPKKDVKSKVETSKPAKPTLRSRTADSEAVDDVVVEEG